MINIGTKWWVSSLLSSLIGGPKMSSTLGHSQSHLRQAEECGWHGKFSSDFQYSKHKTGQKRDCPQFLSLIFDSA